MHVQEAHLCSFKKDLMEGVIKIEFQQLQVNWKQHSQPPPNPQPPTQSHKDRFGGGGNIAQEATQQSSVYKTHAIRLEAIEQSSLSPYENTHTTIMTPHAASTLQEAL